MKQLFCRLYVSLKVDIFMVNTFPRQLKGGYPIIFALNVFHDSHLIQKCIQNQQLLLTLYTLLNQMRFVKNIRRNDDRITSL